MASAPRDADAPAHLAVADYLARDGERELLRFITCGSVDDGKSTLIGRLLHDTGSLYRDQADALAADSHRHGTQGASVDYALLLDGLAAEREQGITIDVAYRYFGTARRRFIVADCPGHEQYTRNMATGASTADVAVVLVDARKGLLTQTRRHSYLLSLFGIHRVLLAVNKMDQVGFDRGVFEAIETAYRQLAAQLDLSQVTSVPMSALHGDNLVHRSPAMPWYAGPSVLEYLESVEVGRVDRPLGFRMPVQWVSRPDRAAPGRDFRGFAGTVAAGAVRVGDAVLALPSGRASSIARIIAPDGDVDSASAGAAVTLTLADEIDISRGDVIAGALDPPPVGDQFAAHLLWMGDEPLLPHRSYWLKVGARTVNASVTAIKHRIDVNTQEQLAARNLELNEVGYCNLHLDEPIAFERYADNRTLGGFILIDRQSNATVGAGTVDFALRRAANLHWQPLTVDQSARARAKSQVPRCVWFTGLSGSGKSTIANHVEKRLLALGHHTYLLDGDNIRHGLNKDLGFTDEDRVENIRRVAEVARLMVDAGLIVLVSFISPFRSERDAARALFDESAFIEVFVDTPIEVAEARDVKGLYAKARRGDLPNFTGIDSPYEVPAHPELALATTEDSVETLADRVVARVLA